LFSIYIY